MLLERAARLSRIARRARAFDLAPPRVCANVAFYDEQLDALLRLGNVHVGCDLTTLIDARVLQEAASPSPLSSSSRCARESFEGAVLRTWSARKNGHLLSATVHGARAWRSVCARAVSDEPVVRASVAAGVARASDADDLCRMATLALIAGSASVVARPRAVDNLMLLSTGEVGAVIPVDARVHRAGGGTVHRMLRAARLLTESGADAVAFDLQHVEQSPCGVPAWAQTAHDVRLQARAHRVQMAVSQDVGSAQTALQLGAQRASITVSRERALDELTDAVVGGVALVALLRNPKSA